MNETTPTYEFWTLDGNLIATIETEAPFDHIGELALFHSVPVDEIEWVEVDPAAAE